MTRIYMRGVQKNDETWSQHRRLVTQNYFWYVLGGNARYISDLEEVSIVPGHLYVMPCNTVFEIIQDPEDMIDHMWILTYPIHNLPRRVLDFDLEKEPIIKPIVMALLAIAQAGLPYHTLATQLDVLLSLLPKEEPVSHKVSEIIDYITNNIDADLSIASLSAHFGYDRSYIGKMFKKSTGITLQEYIYTVRMERACILLSSREKVASVAQAVGYSDSKAFSRAFKNFIKASPASFKGINK